MDNQPAANSSPGSLVRLWPWLIVLAVLLFAGFVRVRLLDMPLERDEGEYAYAGQLILQGIPPYELAYNMKLPGTYYAYALGMEVFGRNIAGIHLTLIAANALTIIFVFLLARQWFGTTAGLVACATYGALSVSPAVMGLAAHANHFVVLCAVPATWLLWKAGGSGRLASLFDSGLLYGLALVMKQQGICFCIFGWMALFFLARDGSAIFSGQFLKRAFCFGSGMILPFALICVLMASAGVFSRFWFWTFTYAGAYVSGQSWHDGWEAFAVYFQRKWLIYAGFLALIAAGLAALRWNRDRRRQAIYAWGFMGFSFLGTATGLYFREHYFILSLPALAILVGMSVCFLQRAFLGMGAAAGLALVLPPALFALALGGNIYYQRQLLFQFPADQVCQIIYRLDPFVEAPAFAAYIHDHSDTNARIAVIGSEPEIYFYSGRHSATGYLYTYPLMEPQPYASTMQKEMIAEIETNQPAYLVWVGADNSWNARPTSDHAIFEWFGRYSDEFYEKVDVPIEGTANSQTTANENLMLYRLKSGAGNAGK